MIDAVLHLDHARDFDDIKQAIDSGYTSVMYDGSHLPFKENILKQKLWWNMPTLTVFL